MCLIVATVRIALWLLVTALSTLGMISAVLNPRWITVFSVHSRRKSANIYSENYTEPTGGISEVQNLGIYYVCNETQLLTGNTHLKQHCIPFVSIFFASNETFPHLWKISLFLISLGIILLLSTILIGSLGCCIQKFGQKSVFTTSGSLQCLSGILFITAILFYASGWGSKKVTITCGSDAQPFYLGNCRIGWALYFAIGTVFLTFLSAILSLQAEASTESQQSTDWNTESKQTLCLW